jgi:xanthine dehydrogenase accessory factor
VSELRALCEAARALRQARQPALLVTLVAARGSSYRRPGARLLIASPDATPIAQCGLPGLAGLTGSVSGGCVERDLALRGWWRLTDGQPTLVSYDSGDDDELSWRLGAGCGGTLDLLLERFDPNGPPAVVDPLSFIDDCVAAQQQGVILTVCRSSLRDVPVGARVAARGSRDVVAPPSLLATSVGAALAAAAHQALAAAGPTRVLTFAGGAVEALIEAVQPPPYLFLCGCGRDAVPVATLARGLGWMVSVWTPRPRFELGARFSRLADHLHTGTAATLADQVNAAACALAVVMTHNLDDDRAALAALLPSRARYIGVLGPRRRTRQLLSELPHPQIPALAGSTARLYAPVGLAIGAETPAEIALAIIGEAQAVLAGVSAAHLRDQDNIHDPAPAIDAQGARR